MLLSILPKQAGVFLFILMSLIVLIIFRFGLSRIKFLFIKANTNTDFTPSNAFVIISLFEVLLLCGLLVNIAFYYSLGKEWYIKLVYYLIAYFCLGAELSKGDRKAENDGASLIIIVFTVIYCILVFWDWLRDSILFSFLFDFLK